MQRMKPLILIALALGLAGCATTGPSYEEMSGRIPGLNPDAGRIFFYLTEYPVKTALIKVNGERVGLLGPMSFFYVDRPAGDHTLQVFRGHTGIISLDKMLLELSPGQTRYVEVLGIDRRLRLLLTEPADAQQTLRKCTFVDPSHKDKEEKP